MAPVSLEGTYAAGLAALGAWGIFTTWQLLRPPSPWSARRAYALAVDTLFTISCLSCALALLAHRFAPSLLLPLGVAYAGMVPVPCYFSFVNRHSRVHLARNALFLLVAAACFAFGLRIVPLSAAGL